MTASRTISTKTINGYGPYKNGEHHWEYLGPVDGGSGSRQDVTNDDRKEGEEMYDPTAST